MKPPAPYLPAASPALSQADQDSLTDLYVRGTPTNTLRAYERDLLYITAWKAARFGVALDWPETETAALAFILDHARDLGDAPSDDRARQTAEALIAQGLRRSPACPAPSTLDRRIASWLAFHRMKNLASPFDAPQVKQARAKARRAAARPPAPKSQHPITRDILEQLLTTCHGSRRDCRDRALLMLGWASGGRRRSEITALMREDVNLKAFKKEGLVWLSLLETKTTAKGETPRLVLKGRAAQALVHWIEVGGIDDGPLFRPISKADRVLKRRLSPDAIAQIVRHRLKLAGLPDDFASPHGLRSGFLTQAALDGAPIQAAMRLSLHRSMAQAQKYYDDVDIAENPTADLLR
ncbi:MULTISPECIES: tyrosine-type recombinase/integrase [unclassified Ruegeria]|uniref:tyrosine-type recombinase/integrase n=1 Tax=unclassified Ruegeria TaxID=2625375 RepID=UPI00149183CF|nr:MULTISPECIES: tyrosine-type recombinase/integrase [unclassified Ruegeria]NOD36528.1 tyrosine-type recombinase/integrase [Ruegeria sp. HKCCD7296]NOE43767.1 tyrosine-type recombinase/integrase [Ruegeria sp. HKCCD7319]